MLFRPRLTSLWMQGYISQSVIQDLYRSSRLTSHFDLSLGIHLLRQFGCDSLQFLCIPCLMVHSYFLHGFNLRLLLGYLSLQLYEAISRG